MSTISIQDAYDAACRLLGEQMVRGDLLERELATTRAERDEAGQRIVELTTPAPEASSA